MGKKVEHGRRVKLKAVELLPGREDGKRRNEGALPTVNEKRAIPQPFRNTALKKAPVHTKGA